MLFLIHTILNHINGAVSWQEMKHILKIQMNTINDLVYVIIYDTNIYKFILLLIYIIPRLKKR